jgi:hypothetical protein
VNGYHGLLAACVQHGCWCSGVAVACLHIVLLLLLLPWQLQLRTSCCCLIPADMHLPHAFMIRCGSLLLLTHNALHGATCRCLQA